MRHQNGEGSPLLDRSTPDLLTFRNTKPVWCRRNMQNSLIPKGLLEIQGCTVTHACPKGPHPGRCEGGLRTLNSDTRIVHGTLKLSSRSCQALRGAPWGVFAVPWTRRSAQARAGQSQGRNAGTLGEPRQLLWDVMASLTNPTSWGLASHNCKILG